MPDVKEQQTKHWNAVAPGWARWLEWTERNFRPLTTWFQRAAGWTPGARALDVACGPGYPALSAAAAVGPDGRVVGADLSAAMIAAGSEYARQRGLTNIAFVEMDADDLQFDEGSFDAVTNAYGLMFSPEPARAVAEAHRVLRPNGRFAFVTWDEPSRNPFFTVIGQVASAFLSLPPAVAMAPGPFRLASADALTSALRAGAFSEIVVDSCPMTFECASAAEYCQIFGDVAWKARIAALSEGDAARFRAAVAAAAGPHVHEGRLLLHSTSLCASGRK